MTSEIVKFIFLFLLGTTLINFAIAMVARFKTGHKEFNILIYYWVSLLAMYGAAFFLNANPTQIAFAYFFQFIPAFLNIKVLRDSRNIYSNWEKYLAIQLAASGISTVLLLETNLGFTISLLPVVISTILSSISPVWDTLVTNRKSVNWVEKSLGFVTFTAIVNHINYAFFRLDESTAWWGWSISIAQYQCISVFLPLLINYRRESNEKRNLQAAIEMITGQNSNYNFEVEELYNQLELEIAQKDDFNKRLQAVNLNLEEEQETNELLIRTISHDLANPLTVMNAYLAMLLAGKIQPDEVPKIHLRIKNNIESASDMIDRTRKAIVTRTKASLVDIKDISVDEVISQLNESFETRLRAKNVSIVYENPFPGIMIRADKSALLEHVLSNVMSNAIKFSFENGTIFIRIRTDGESVSISLKDQGTGIEESRLSKRLLSSTLGTSGESGSGFGIMVLGYFMRKFEGTFSLTSSTHEPDRGTTVTLVLKKSHATSQMPIIRVAPANSHHHIAH